MIILLEGPDSTGKTTLCNKLIEYFTSNKKSVMYKHNVKDDNTPFGITKQLRLFDFSKWNNFNLIVDRSSWSNVVYQTIFSDGYQMDLNCLKEFNSYFDKIIVTLPKDKQRYIDKFNEMKNSRHEEYCEMSKVYDRYEDLLNGKIYPELTFNKEVIRYDMFDHPIDDLDKYVKQIIEEEKSVC